jgi:hypothetical protein
MGRSQPVARCQANTSITRLNPPQAFSPRVAQHPHHDAQTRSTARLAVATHNETRTRAFIHARTHARTHTYVQVWRLLKKSRFHNVEGLASRSSDFGFLYDNFMEFSRVLEIHAIFSVLGIEVERGAFTC